MTYYCTSWFEGYVHMMIVSSNRRQFFKLLAFSYRYFYGLSFDVFDIFLARQFFRP